MADANSFIKVADAIQNEKDVKIIVVSAGGKVGQYPKITDMLLNAYRKIVRGESVIKSLAGTFDRLRELKSSLKLKIDLESELKKIEEAAYNAKFPDFLLSRGEYIYSMMFAEFCGLPFIDAADIYKFDDKSKLNAGLTYYKLNTTFKKKGIFVTGGFYGSDDQGRIITFSRGGGDISGAIAARAVKADVFVDFTDVDGVYAYDPQIIRQSKPLERLSYDQIRVLGEFGAIVLHPDAVLPLIDAGIPVIIKNTFSPKKIGTYISGETINSTFAAAAKDGCGFISVIKAGYGRQLIRALKTDGLIGVSVTGDRVDALYNYGIDLSDMKNIDASVKSTNAITTFYITDCSTSREFMQCVDKCTETNIVIKNEYGYIFAVNGNDKKIVESLIEKFL